MFSCCKKKENPIIPNQNPKINKINQNKLDLLQNDKLEDKEGKGGFSSLADKMMHTSLKQTWEQEKELTTTTTTTHQIQNLGTAINFTRSHKSEQEDDDDEENKSGSGEETSRMALTVFKEREEEIERKKLEMKEKVHAQLGRVEGEIRRLAAIRQELEALADPRRKEVTNIRKKIDAINRDLKPLEKNCQKKEREYKEAVEVINAKNKEKTQLHAKLMELVSESEKLRMMKLEELGKNIEAFTKIG